ncbi:MAG: acetate kinase, partial [Lentisphaeria bacterium]
AFHANMPDHAKRYAVPNKWHDEAMVAKYGFHGTSFQYISRKYGAIKNIPHTELNMVIAHIGNGASISKVEAGVGVDTSMGLTPLDGCVMGSRCGNIDAGVIEYIAKTYNMTIAEIMSVLNKESGLKGFTGTNNMFLVWQAMKNGDKNATIGFEVAAYRTAYICAGYMATMKNPHAIVFTAGVGENNGDYRRAVLNYMSFFNFKIDEETINKRGAEVKVAEGINGIEAWVIPTNEELILGEDSISIAETNMVPEKYSFEK